MGFKVTRHTGQEVRIGEALVRIARVGKNRTVDLYIEAPQSVRIVIVKADKPEGRDSEMGKS